MSRFLSGTRYLILIPVLGLAIAAAAFFIFGGIGLVGLLFEFVTGAWEPAHAAAGSESGLAVYEVIEYVHTFLVGTVLYITAVGLFQLFIHDIETPRWLKVENTEELENSLISVTVVVLAVTFMGGVVAGDRADLLETGAGIALPIAALGVFIGLRAWAARQGREPAGHKDDAAD